MTRRNPNKSQTIIRLLLKIVYWGAVFGAVFVVYLVYLRFSNVGLYYQATFEQMLLGEAYRPFAYRVLMPILSRILAHLVPAFLTEFLALGPIAVLSSAYVTLQGSTYPREVSALLVCIFLSLAGFSLVVHIWMGKFGYSHLVRHAGTIVLLFGINLFTFFNGYVYDLPQLFLFTSALYWMYRSKWGWYLALFTVAALNKETAILLVLPFAYHAFRTIPRDQFARLLAAQVVLYSAIRVVTLILFRNNPGEVIRWHVDKHIDFFAAYPAILVGLSIVLSALIYLISRDFNRKPLFLRRSLVILPILAVLYLIGGFPMEFRVFLEVYAPAGILLLPAPVHQPSEDGDKTAA